MTTNPPASGNGMPMLLAFYQEQEIDDADQTQVETPERAPESPSGPLAPIFVAPGSGGTIIVASEDIAALDQFEALLNAIAGRVGGGPDYAVFYLKYAKASVVAETVGRIFAGRATSTAGGTGAAGGLLGSTTATSGSLDIIPDPRLNALFVEGNPADFETLEQILTILDQQTSPEDVQITAKPQLIPVYNTSAEEVAMVVRQIYQDRLMSASGNSGRAQSPADFFQALRGGRGGFGGGDRGSRGGRGGRGGSSRQRGNGESEVTRMSIGVDVRSNSLVVLAPQPLFQEVEVLVARLDQATTEVNETMRVITLNQSNPQAVQQALAAILGDSLTTSSSSNRSNSRSQNRSNGRGGSTNSSNDRRDFMRQLFQQGGGGRGGPGGGRGRGGRGGSDRGGGGRRGGGR